MPRLPLIPDDDLDAADRATLAALDLGQRAGLGGAIFAALAHRPAILHATLAQLDALLAPGTVDAATKEIVSLRVTLINPCVFCMQQALATRFHVPADLLEALVHLDDHRDRFTAAHYAALRYAEMVTTSAMDVDAATWSALQDHFSDAAIVELTALITGIGALNRFADALALT